MAILTSSGRSAAAAAIKERSIHMAWGGGSPLWDVKPESESADAVALTDEVGRRRVTSAQFCLPDPQGELVVPTGRFTVSAVPTKYLYLRFSFDFADAPASTIREVAVFSGTTPTVETPVGQDYIIPSEILDPGLLLVIEHLDEKMIRSASVRQQFEFVIQF